MGIERTAGNMPLASGRRAPLKYREITGIALRARARLLF
jgi:hypothetical protein